MRHSQVDTGPSTVVIVNSLELNRDLQGNRRLVVVRSISSSYSLPLSATKGAWIEHQTLGLKTLKCLAILLREDLDHSPCRRCNHAALNPA